MRCLKFLFLTIMVKTFCKSVTYNVRNSLQLYCTVLFLSCSAVVIFAIRLLFMFLGTALRVTTGGKPGQTSLIQIPSSTQFAVVSQGNLLSVGQPRMLQTQLTNQQVQKLGFILLPIMVGGVSYLIGGNACKKLWVIKTSDSFSVECY